jgi:hypothetical protein
VHGRPQSKRKWLSVVAGQVTSGLGNVVIRPGGVSQTGSAGLP